MADIARKESPEGVHLTVRPFEGRPLMEIVAILTRGKPGRNPDVKVRFTGASVTDMLTMSELSVWLGSMHQLQGTINVERDKLKTKPEPAPAKKAKK